MTNQSFERRCRARGRLETTGDLQRDPECLGQRHGIVSGARSQVFAFDELHDEESSPIGVFDGVDPGNVRMIERRENLGLALESRQSLRIRRQGLGQHLDRHLAPEVRVLSAIHLSHTAFADLVDDAVMQQGLAWLYGK